MSELTAGERLALLKKEHGDLSNVIKETTKYTYIVYNSSGDILSKSLEEPDMSLYTECKYYKFNTSDVEIIDAQGKSIAQFYIKEDEHDVCHIKLRTIEKVTLKSDRDFLDEVIQGVADPDIIISYDDSDWILTRNNESIESNIVLYITLKGDPHFLYERVVFGEQEVNADKICKKPRKNEMDKEFSIYTFKGTHTYSRK